MMKYLYAMLIVLLLSVTIVGAQDWHEQGGSEGFHWNCTAVQEISRDFGDRLFASNIQQEFTFDQLFNLLIPDCDLTAEPEDAPEIDSDYIMRLFEDGSDEAVRELYALNNPTPGQILHDRGYCGTLIDMGLGEFTEFKFRMNLALQISENCLGD